MTQIDQQPLGRACSSPDAAKRTVKVSHGFRANLSTYLRQFWMLSLLTRRRTITRSDQLPKHKEGGELPALAWALHGARALSDNRSTIGISAALGASLLCTTLYQQ